MCESIVVVGAALSADVVAPTERVHSAPGARGGQSPKQHRLSNRRANVLAVRAERSFAAGAREASTVARREHSTPGFRSTPTLAGQESFACDGK